jgi:uncharacterized membrane protein (GlpM family)
MNYADLLLKITCSAAVVITATALARKLPSLAGLIATMPLTALMVMIWITFEHGGQDRMTNYSRGAFWGVLPSMLFYGAAYICYRRGYTLPAVLAVSFAVWLIAAGVHYSMLGGK